MTMMTNKELNDRLDSVVKQIKKKKEDVNKILTDLENLCREALSLQKKLENVGENKSQ